MLDEYNLTKFIVVFAIIVISLLFIYIYIQKFGSFPISNRKGNIKVIEIKHITKDKGFLLVGVKDKLYFFSFDNSGIKLIEKLGKNFLDEEKDTNT